MTKKEIVRRVFLASGIVLLAVMLATLVAVGRRRTTEDTTASAEPKADSAEAIHILVAGEDRTSGLCDVLMLVRVETDAKRATVLQIPRDTYAAFTDGSYRKLNGAAKHLGGMAELCDFLSESFGVPIDRYVLLDGDALRSLVDAIGGVTVTLPEALDYDDPAQSLSIHLPAGRQTLDGEAAEAFVRYRSGYVRGDLGRMDAQKMFLASLVRSLRASLDLSSGLRLAASLLPHLHTNLSPGETLRLVRAAYAMAEADLLLLTLPGEEAVATQSGASYYVASSKATDEILVWYFSASEGSFDRKQVFRNPRYQHFCAIYDGYSAYTAYPVSEIAEEGIEIEKTP